MVDIKSEAVETEQIEDDFLDEVLQDGEVGAEIILQLPEEPEGARLVPAGEPIFHLEIKE